MNKLTKYITLSLMLLLMAGCRHKDLEEEYWGTMTINVVFDWKNAPDANPSSMALYLFNEKGGEPLRYVFRNNTGGEIKVPYGRYIALCINNDNTDWAELRNTGDMDTFEIHSATISGSTDSDMNTSGVTGREADPHDESLVVAPDLLWTDCGEVISLTPSDTEKTLIMYPEEYGCHYIIDIYDIENPTAFEDRELFATFSGLADGYDPASCHPSHYNVTMPMNMYVSEDGSQIHGEFVNFGECPDIIYKNELKLHSYLSDGSVWSYTFDVTDQAHNAPDPRHVHIILRGLPAPKPINDGSGLKPVVDDWIAEHYNLNM